MIILPSLEIVPAKFNGSTLLSQIPIDGTGDFSVTRATSATRVNGNGLIEVAKTNLALRSEEFRTIAEGGPSNTWTANDTVIISVNNPSPDGTNNATRIRGAASPANRARQQVIVGTSGIVYVGSAWIRRVSGTSPITLRVGDAGSSTNISPESTWQRYSFSSTPTTTTVRIGFIFPNDTDEFEIWGAQLEEGSFASEYIPTTTVARTTFAGVTVDGTAAANIPRLDYLQPDGTIGCPALLVEPSAQNQCQRSEEFNNAFHFPFNLNAFGSGSVANTTATLDPYGTNVADYVQENSAASAQHSIIDIFAGNVSGTTYTWSVFAKAAERTIIQLANNAGGGGVANFNLTTGVATLTNGVSCSMQNYGNGWWRCVLTYISNVTGNHNVQIRLCDASGNSSYNGTGNQGAYIFGAQLEVGSVATSYIPTTVSGVTRAADVIIDTTASGVIGQTEGAIYAEFEHTSNTAERRLIALSDGTVTNRIFIWAINNILYAQIQGNSMIIANPIPSGYNKVAFAYQQNGVSGNLFASINGGAVVSGTSTTYPSTLSRVALGNTENVGGVFQWNNRIRAAALYQTRLTNTQLALLTSPYTSYSSMASALSYTLG